MLRWLILSTLLAQSILAARWNLDKILDDYDIWRRGAPSVHTTASSFDTECIKDILIIWDNSQSVGLSAFQDSVKPFLKNLVSSPKLNVGKDGTHIGIITFSSPARTYSLLEIGNITSPDKLTSYLDTLDYENKLMGPWTFTGDAFAIANNIFDQTSPMNHRPEIADVILLFTDGEPRASKNYLIAEQEQLADDSSAALKSRDVKVIGLAIGRQNVLDRFLPHIQTWASPGSVFTTEVSEMNNVLDQLVADTCKPAGDCGCDTIIPDVQYANKGDRAPVRWIQPTFKCTENRPDYDVTITPEGTRSGQMFEIGEHTVVYTFKYNDAGKRRTLKCPIRITVAECSCPSQQTTIEGMIGPNEETGVAKWKVPVPNCPAQLVSPASAPDVETRRFSKGEHLVQYVYQHKGGTGRLTCDVNIKMEECKCPIQTKIVKGAIGPNEVTGVARWEVPVPSCAAKLISPKPYGQAPGFDSKRFGEGDHTEEYVYEHESGLRITCGVKINIEVCKCRPTTQTVRGQIEDDNAKAAVSWSNPKPKCTVTDNPANPVEPSGTYSVGEHTLTYRYTYAPNTKHSLDIDCSVKIVIEGPRCGENRYDPATHVCCCGKMYKKEAGYDCCGFRYYDTTNGKKCCNEKRGIICPQGTVM